MNNELLAKIAALQTMPFSNLKKLWREMYETDLPGLNRKWIVDRLAYRIQELALEKDIGSLEQRLDALAKVRLGNDLKKERKHPIHRPLTGTRLIRDYSGVEYQVTVLADGNLHPMEAKKAAEDKAYVSVSAQDIFGETNTLTLVALCSKLQPDMSKGQMRRLIDANAVSVNGQKASDPQASIAVPPGAALQIQIGKRGYYSIS